MLVYQAYRFELDPNNHARSALASHAGAARFAFNWGLDLVSNRLSARRTLAVLAMGQGAGRTEAEAWAQETLGPVPQSLPALRREWNQAKADVAPWWSENSKESYNSGLDALVRALEAWSKSRRGLRKGRAIGFPHFKTKSTARQSFRVTTGTFGVTGECHVRLPRIGAIRTKEPTTKPAVLLAAGGARVLSATVSEAAGRWYVSFGCEVEREPVATLSGPPVGVDLAVLSSGERVANPRHLSRYQRRMARLQRECSRRRGPAKGRGTLQALEALQGPAGPHSRQGGCRPLRRAAQAHHQVGHHFVHRGGRGPGRGRDDRLCQGLGPLAGKGWAQPGHVGRFPGRAAPPARLQDRLVRLDPGGRRQVVSLLQDLLSVQGSESQAVPL